MQKTLYDIASKIIRPVVYIFSVNLFFMGHENTSLQ